MKAAVHSPADLELMRSALAEALKGGRAVRPNPLVGAALRAKDGRVVVAHHKAAGGPHAEAEVLAACARQGVDPRGATIAVTLEPCRHQGRTPPCTQALITAGVARVIVGVRDPHPKAGGGGEDLRKAGIEVVEGLLQEACEEINARWLASQRQSLPFIVLKMATSMDGLWSAQDGSSKWITGEAARAHGHTLRAEVDAIVTSARTVRADNPQFTARPSGKAAQVASEVTTAVARGQSAREAAAARGKADLVQPQVFVLSSRETLDLRGTALEKHPAGARSLLVKDLRAFAQGLQADGLHQVMVEAGPGLTAAFLNAGLFNEVWHYQGARFLGGEGLRLPVLAGGHLPGLQLRLSEFERFADGDSWSRWIR